MGASASLQQQFKQVPFISNAFKQSDVYQCFYKQHEIIKLGYYFVSIRDSGKNIPSTYEIHFLAYDGHFKSFDTFLIAVKDNYTTICDQYTKHVTVALENIARLSTHVTHCNDFILEYNVDRLQTQASQISTSNVR